MTLDTPHGPITKFLKKCLKNAGKIEGGNYFSPLWCMIQKLDHNSGLHAKNQREISKNEVRSPPPLYGNVDIPLYISIDVVFLFHSFLIVTVVNFFLNIV